MDLEQVKITKMIDGVLKEFSLPEAISVYALYVYRAAKNENPYKSFDDWLNE